MKDKALILNEKFIEFIKGNGNKSYPDFVIALEEKQKEDSAFNGKLFAEMIDEYEETENQRISVNSFLSCVLGIVLSVLVDVFISKMTLPDNIKEFFFTYLPETIYQLGLFVTFACVTYYVIVCIDAKKGHSKLAIRNARRYLRNDRLQNESISEDNEIAKKNKE